ncbi:TIGR00730 family Rossman fold protein [Lentisphaera profundi]|uniref:Cytokinin riboside 5'-monophosphate phosphoribohydrolase n=1 Tax=Lentisphaera profundi TaxID=1658616 RepID=A0ABY7VQ99_9BACT|nr:TIGR00730 family Rossman fold protein [Lentisphaera profundi]WDE95489.1 TIGR00730 family Rossman fold protein [Lentisphaera profundi]
MNKLNITVYCASSPNIHQDYFDSTKELGELLSLIPCTVSYGGGASGLMGALADSMIHHGGEIRGFIPQFMIEREWQHLGVPTMHIVKTMHERKEKLLENCDVAIALAGGCGTLEEFMEALTWKQLELFKGKLMILNTKSYYNPLLELLNGAIHENFMAADSAEMWEVHQNPQSILDSILSKK